MARMFLDSSIEVDTVNHNILLRKLYAYGIRCNKLKNYLTGRKQYVKYNNIKSTIEEINCGVLQDSILGPLLFII